MDSILDFWHQMTANPLLFIAVTLTLGVILVNSWTDALNAIATCVVTRCVPPKAAILMAGLTSSAIALHNSFEGVNGAEWIKVVYGIGISVGLGFGLGWLVYKAVTMLFYKANRPKTEPFFRGTQIIGTASMAFNWSSAALTRCCTKVWVV